MAKLKVKLRPSRVDGKAGTIYYCVSHRSIVRHITTSIRIHPRQWDAARQSVVSGDPDLVRIQNRIDSDMATLKRIILELDVSQREFTSAEVVERFRAPERHISVPGFLEEQIRFLTECNRYGTALNYRRAAATLNSFLDGRDLCFPELTACFVEQYSDFLLRRGMVRNSLSFHMRILRAVYNKAVRRGYTEQSFPFRDVYTGIDRTRKRAVGEDIISRLIQLDIDDNPSLLFARDLFLFSFYTRGMAFVDIVYLRKSNIQDGVIRYARHKTGQQLVIRIEPCIRAIIDRYAPAVYDLPYVFPILMDEDPVTCFNQYKSELRSYNYRLKVLSRCLGLESGLSSYTSRHSWATAARNRNVPLSVISAGMGHSSERTTQIYLTSLENSLIDSANLAILEQFQTVP